MIIPLAIFGANVFAFNPDTRIFTLGVAELAIAVGVPLAPTMQSGTYARELAEQIGHPFDEVETTVATDHVASVFASVTRSTELPPNARLWVKHGHAARLGLVLQPVRQLTLVHKSRPD